MADKELVRRALLGSREAQQECTEKVIVLPCPSCGGKSRLEDMGWPHHVYCTECGMRTVSTKWGGDGEKEAIKKWNTRPVPPIGRCGECVFSRELTKDDQKEYFDVIIEHKDVCMCAFLEQPELRWKDDFCSYFEPRED